MGKCVRVVWSTILLVIVWPSLASAVPSFAGPGSGKRVDRNAATPGSVVSFTIDLVNEGDQPATSVVLDDVLPAGFTYRAGTLRLDGVVCTDAVDADRCSVSGGSIRITLGTITQTGDRDRKIAFEATLGNLPDGSIVCNSATVSATELGTAQTLGPACTAVVLPSIGQPEKTASDVNGAPLVPDDVITWTVTVPGNPFIPMNGLVIQDDIPNFARFVSVTSPGGGAVNESNPTGGPLGRGRVRFTNVNIPAGGSVSFTITAQIDDEAEWGAAGVPPGGINGRRICNQAQVSGGGLTFTVRSDDPGTTATADLTCTQMSYAPNLGGSSKVGVDDNRGVLQPGDTITYTLTVRNGGTRTGTFGLTDDLPAGIDSATLLSAPPEVTFTPGGGASGTGQLTMSGLVLAPQASALIRVRVRVRPDTPDGVAIQNSAQVTVLEAPAANRTLSSGRLVVFARPVFDNLSKRVTDLDGGALERGDTVRYDLTVSNTGGNRPGTNVTLIDPVPAGLTSVVPSAGGLFDPVARTVTWITPTLAVNARLTVSLTAVVAADAPFGALLENQATIDSIEPTPGAVSDDPTTAAVDDPTRIRIVAAPTVSVVKSVVDDNGGQLAPGDTLSWTIVVSHTGGTCAVGLELLDIVDDRQDQLAAGQGGAVDAGAGQVLWTIPRLCAGDPPRTFTLSSRVRPGTVDATSVCNQAQAQAGLLAAPVPSDDPGTLQAGDATCLVVRSPLGQPSLTVSKTAADDDGGALLPGDTVTYTISVSNVGSGPSDALTLIDPAPGFTTYLPGSTRVLGVPVADGPEAGGPLAGTGLALSALAAGATTTVTFRATVNGPTGAEISNQAQLLHRGVLLRSDDPTTLAPVDPTVIAVGAGPLLTGAFKTFDPTPIDDDGDGVFEAGEGILFLLVVENRGVSAASNLRIEDVLPEGVTYRSNTLRENGTLLSDAADADAGELDGDLLRVHPGSLAPGGRVIVSFEVTIDPGTVEVSNQGLVSADGLTPEPTDADGDETNGDQATVVPVRGAGGQVTVSKTVVDENGGTIMPGDTLAYSIVVASALPVTGARLIDVLPSGLIYLTGSTVWPGLPADPFSGGSLDMPGLNVQGSLTVRFRTRVASTAALGSRICNSAGLTAGTQTVESAPACVVVGQVPGTASLRGRAFVDDASHDGQFTAGRDEPLPGLPVKVLAADGHELAAVVTDAQGLYSVDGLLPGDLVVRLESAHGAQLDRVAVQAGGSELTVADLAVDPSGRVYDSRSGALLAGVKVSLRYDESDASEPGQPVPPERLAPGQQDQLTGADGIYRFDVQPGRKYALVVDPGTTGYVFPSALYPPHDGFAPPGPVVPEPTPSAAAGASHLYYLRFDIQGANSEVLNNHLPLDAASEAVRLDKRVDRPSARTGELVVYTITVENQGTVPLTGVRIRDEAGSGLQIVPESTAFVRKNRTTGAAGTVQGGGHLAFTRDGAGVSFGPLELAVGDTFVLVYQAVVSVDADAGVVENRARLIDAAGTSRSNEDTARLRVENDPIFDEGAVFGRVFCDDDDDDTSSARERGVMGARIYADSGRYAVSDARGQFHLAALDPGMHLFKLDPDTLPWNAGLTGDGAATLYLTRGLVTRVDFAVHCKAARVVTGQDPLVKLRGPGEPPQGKPESKVVPLPALTITGDLGAGSLLVNGTPVELPRVSLTLEAPPAIVAVTTPVPNLLPPGRWAGAQPAFRIAAHGGTIASWRLELAERTADGGSASLVTLRGSGDPQAVVWDGKDALGVQAHGDRALLARVWVQLTDGSEAESPPLAFGLGYGLREAAPTREILRGKFFTGRPPRATRELEQQLAAYARRLPADGEVLIEVHADGKGDAIARAAETQRQADAVARVLVASGVAPGRIKAKGRGNMAPLAPARSKQGAAQNRRIELLYSAPAAPVTAQVPLAPMSAPAVQVAGRPVVLDGNRFSLALPQHASKVVVEATLADGGKARVVLAGDTVRPAATVSPGQRKVVIDGNLGSASFTVDGTPVDGGLAQVAIGLGSERSAAMNLGLHVPKGRKKAADGLVVPLAVHTLVPPSIQVARWRLVISPGASDSPLHVIDGAGAVPEEIGWDGKVDGKLVLVAGLYRVRLELVDRGGQRVLSAPARLSIGGGKGGAFAPLFASGSLLTPTGMPGTRLKNVLSTFRSRQRGRPAGERYTLLLEVAGPSDEALRLKQVAAVRGYLARLGIPVARVDVQIIARAPGQKDSRVKIAAIALPTAGGPGRVVVNGQALELAGDHFHAELVVGERELLEVEMTAPDGGELTWRVPPPATPLGPAPLATATTGEAPRAPARSRASMGPAAAIVFGPGDEGVPEAGIQAANLTVELPERGLVLAAPDLWVGGTTDLANQLSINGRQVVVGAGGRFDELVSLPVGASRLVIESKDPAGHVARLEWPVEVKTSQHFLLAIGDGAVSTAYAGGEWGAEGARLDGMTSATTTTAGPLLLHGRLALYYKGRFKAGEVWDQVKVTAHLDTARRAQLESFFDQTLDPSRDVTVWGDAAGEVQDAQARGKLYVLVEADDSKAIVGNFNTGLSSGGLFRYDRTVYGAGVDLRSRLGPVNQRLQGFASDDGSGTVRGIDVFRATGGTLYYLRHGQLVIGSARLRIVIRDRDSGLELDQRTLVRDQDYLVDEADGRIMLKSPLPSSVASDSLIDNLDVAVTPGVGHPVYLEASYDYEPEAGEGQRSAGVRLEDTFGDLLTLGGGFVVEDRPAGDYLAGGGDATLHLGQRSAIRFELVGSKNESATTFISTDGGLSFGRLARQDTGEAETAGLPDSGRAYKLSVDATLGDWVDADWARGTKLQAWWQDVDAGYAGDGAVLDGGHKKLGAQLTWAFAPELTMVLRGDQDESDAPRVGPTVDDVTTTPLVIDHRTSDRVSLRLVRQLHRFGWGLEVSRQSLASTARDAGGQLLVDSVRYGAAAEVSWRASRHLVLTLRQEGQVHDGSADPVLEPLDPLSGLRRDEPLAGVATSLAARWELASDLQVGALASVRWNGDVGGQLGLRTPVGEGSAYTAARAETAGGHGLLTSVFGAEDKVGDAGRAYGEYQLRSGVGGMENRAVLGVGHRFRPARGVGLALGYEHQESQLGALPDGTSVGGQRRDVAHVGLELLSSLSWKASASFEIRYDVGAAGLDAQSGIVTTDLRPDAPGGSFADHGGPVPGAALALPHGRRVQIVTSAAADWKWSESQTFLARFRLADTRRLGDADAPDRTEARFLEATVGWAIRPLSWDALDLLVRYSYLIDLRPLLTAIGDEASVERHSHVVAVVPVLTLPGHFELSAKLAWKRQEGHATLLDLATSKAEVDAMLSLLRLSWRFSAHWDLAVEGRLLHIGREHKNGALFELDYRLSRWVRLGLGYNLSHFSDDELGELETDTHGVFFRVVGRF